MTEGGGRGCGESPVRHVQLRSARRFDRVDEVKEMLMVMVLVERAGERQAGLGSQETEAAWASGWL